MSEDVRVPPLPQTDREAVIAVVLTFEAPEALAQCLAALASQTHPVDRVVVVDNASSMRAQVVVDAQSWGVPVEVMRLVENVGPAGGHAAGLQRFLSTDARWAWVMDDDTIAEPAALATMLHVADGLDRPFVMRPKGLVAGSGEVLGTQGWCGVLIPREIVEDVGIPNADLVWWTEDTEYLQWRIPEAGYRTWRVDEAVVRVHRHRDTAEKPTWKYYYESRNQVFHRVHVQGAGGRSPIPRHLTVRVRWYRAGKAVTKLAARAILREHTERGAKTAMVLRGAVDGLRGRLGLTVPLGNPDRPVLVSPSVGETRGRDR